MMTQKGNLYSLLKLYYAENNNFLLMTHDYDRPSFTVKSCGNCWNDWMLLTADGKEAY